MPRVGSSSSRMAGFVSSQRPMMHFCWLPPERPVIAACGPGVLTPVSRIGPATRFSSRCRESRPPRRASARLQRLTLPATSRSGNSPSRLRSSVTIAIRASQASRGCRKRTGLPSSRISPVQVGSPAPKIVSKSSVRPAPIRPATPRISPACRSNDTFDSR